jgi:hypothetical protein
MKNITKLLLFVTLASGFGILIYAQVKMDKELKDKAQAERQKQILEGNYEVAKQTLDEAVLSKDTSTIKIALKQRRFGPVFQSDAVAAVEQLRSQEFVPDLVEALEKNQGIAWRGGSEIDAEQKKLSGDIVSVLSFLTGIQFPSTDNLTPQDIETILRLTHEWWKVHGAK